MTGELHFPAAFITRRGFIVTFYFAKVWGSTPAWVL